MRRVLHIIIGAALAAGLVGAVSAPAGAQTGNLAAFCAARLEGNDAEGKAANLAVMNKALAAAPPDIAPAMTALRDAYAKKGDKLFNGGAGLQLINDLDALVYEKCPGTKVPVTAIDYEFEGMPATLPAGPVNFKLTNNAPKEDHMLALQKLNAKGEAIDVDELLALPEKKAGQYLDQTTGAFMYAPAGQVGYGPTTLTPGEYIYACFISQPGKKGEPHFMLGMKGTLTVQ